VDWGGDRLAYETHAPVNPDVDEWVRYVFDANDRTLMALRLSGQKMLYQSDLFMPSSNSFPDPARVPVMTWFVDWLDRSDLEVETIYAVHGSARVTDEQRAPSARWDPTEPALCAHARTGVRLRPLRTGRSRDKPHRAAFSRDGGARHVDCAARPHSETNCFCLPERFACSATTSSRPSAP
jgi:hypothetical protein